jgi:hypothetical protein
VTVHVVGLDRPNERVDLGRCSATVRGSTTVPGSGRSQVCSKPAVVAARGKAQCPGIIHRQRRDGSDEREGSDAVTRPVRCPTCGRKDAADRIAIVYRSRRTRPRRAGLDERSAPVVRGAAGIDTGGGGATLGVPRTR